MFDIGINILGIVFLGLCAFAALNDFARMLIPNWLNVAIFSVALGTGFLLALGGTVTWVTFGWHVAYAAIAFVVGFIMFSLRIVGGGDAKFFPGALMWVGPAGWIYFLVYTTLIAGVVAASTLIWRQLVKFSPTLVGFSSRFKSLHAKKGMPLGIAISAGVFLASVYSPFMGDGIGGLFLPNSATVVV